MLMYEPRTYRHWVRDKDLVSFDVMVEETDLHIRALTNLEHEAHTAVIKYRDILKRYIEQHPVFLTSLEPVSVAADIPALIKEMAAATAECGVGPMASVAGAIAEFVGRELLALSPEIIIENGGDIYLRSQKKRIIGIYAGESPLSGQIALEIAGSNTPSGICTSSGTVGHSLSFGQADAVIVLAPSAILADAAATAIGNLIIQANDIPKGIEFAQNIEGLTGVIIIKDDRIGMWGEVKICETSA